MALDLSSAPTAPPKTGQRQTSSTGKSKPSPIKDARIERRTQAVVDVCQLAYGGLAMLEQYADAGAIALHGPALSYELAKLAEDNSSVAEAIDKLGQASPYAALIMVLFRFGGQLAANHGLIKSEKAQAIGGKDPKALAEETQAKIRMQAIQSARDARAMQEEAAEMTRLYEEEMRQDELERIRQAEGAEIS